MGMQDQVVGWVHRSDQLKAETESLWTKTQECISAGHVDDAITLLNAYFGLQDTDGKIRSKSKESAAQLFLGQMN
jgi:hypothetical protein